MYANQRKERMTTTATNGIIYREDFGSIVNGTGSLVVKQIRRDGSLFSLIGYVHPGIDIAPIVFAHGALDECRKAYRMAKASMQRWYA
jgi:hypothetical protein